jgi:hypothetical protein
VSKKLKDIHIFLEEEDLEEFKKRLCTHKGDLTWHLQCAVKEYLARHGKLMKEVESVEALREEVTQDGSLNT